MTFGASLASAISIEETHPPYRFLENPISIEKPIAEIWNMAATRRSCFLLSALYDLPFGANRGFHSHSNRIAYLAPGGWSVSAVSLWETGPYLKPTRSSSYGPGNLSLSYRGGFPRPHCIANGDIATNERMFKSTPSTQSLRGQSGIAVSEYS